MANTRGCQVPVGSRGPDLLRDRDEQLSAIDSALEAARRGSGTLILFEGVPGLGKSALVREAVRRAEVVGMLVGRADCREIEKNLPHGVSRRLFGPLLERLTEAQRKTSFAGSAALAEPLFNGTDASGETDLDHAFTRVHGLYSLCANLSEIAPVLLTVDDAHWSDPASLRFFTYLARRLDQLSVTVILTARPYHHVLGGALQDLREHPFTRTSLLDPLSPKATTDLVRDRLGDTVSDEVARSYHEASEGNPFLLLQLLETASASDVEPFSEVGATEPGVEALAGARRRIADLDDNAVRLARAIAILGSDATDALCGLLVDLLPEVTQASHKRLVEARMIASEHGCAFVHPLIADAILESCPPDELERLYARAARLLHAGGTPAEKVASYLLLCPPSDEIWVRDVLKEAALNAFSAGAPLTAATHLERLLSERLDSDERAEALISLARAEVLTDSERALARLREASSLLEDPIAQAQVYRQIGLLLYGVGRHEQAAQAFEDGLSAVDGRDEKLQLELEVDLIGVDRLILARREEALQRLRRLTERRVPSEPGRPEPIRLYTELALDHIRRGESREAALQALDRALPDPEGPWDGALDGNTLPVLLHCLAWVDEYDRASNLTEAALGEARRKGSVMLFATAGCFGALAAFHSGRISEAISLAEQALDAVPDGWGLGLPFASTIAVYGYIERGELDLAEQVLGGTLADEGWESSTQYGFLLETRARLAMAWGNYELAVNDLRGAGRALVEGIRTNNPSMLAWRSRLARALTPLGQTTEALDLANEEVDLARRFGAPRALAAALRVRGQLLGSEGLSDLEEAVTLAAEAGARLEQASTLVSFGRVLRLRGDLKDARRVLNDGLRLAVRSGSVLLEGTARSELTAAGARPRRRAVTGMASLTPGEKRVAELAAKHMTNREIADSLFVTVKAVEWHLSNAYRKLGITSREDLAGIVFESEDY